jgi:crotonobetainyl-CoA:carnitine CoA-transferase CaiB-like acyl-CoA transferase
MSPLSKLRVLELGGDVAVRYCGRLFASQGALVTRVGETDDTLLGQGGEAGVAYGQWLDQGKSISSAAGDGHFDLVIAGQTQGAVEAGHHVAACLPGSPPVLGLTWFDRIGPYAGWRGNDAVLHALNGCAYAFGQSQGSPLLAQGHSPQIVAGLTGFIGSMAALMSSPRAERIDVNVFEAAMCFTETSAVAAVYSGARSQRLGVNRFVPTYPCSIYPTADGYVGITALTPAQWASLCGLIDRPELATDPRFSTSLQRLMEGDLIDELLMPAFARRTTMDWVRDGDRLRIPTTPVPRPGEMPFVEHWKTRESFSAVGQVMAPDLPFRHTWSGATLPVPSGGANGPLTGIKVADFSMGWAGPLAARYLGDFGADVMKIESTTRPDWWRGWEVVTDEIPPSTEIQRNFLAVNRNKRGLDLDLTTDQGLSIARSIISTSDVVIENLGPGVMDRLGLGQDVQRKLNPTVTSISMPPFGKRGPLAGLRAYGSTVEQACGMPFVNGFQDWAPCLQHVAYGDPVAGLYAAASALTALYARDFLGGADIELCQVECLFELGADAIIGEQVTGLASPRTGSARVTAPLCCTVQCADDGWVAVSADAVDIAALWRLLKQEVPTLVDTELEVALAEWASTREPAKAASELQAVGVAAAPVQPAHGLATDLQLQASDFWIRRERQHVGEHLMPASPIRLDGVRPSLRRVAPLLGEHTDEVIAEMRSK